MSEPFEDWSSDGRGSDRRRANFRVLSPGDLPAADLEQGAPHSAEAEEHVIACCLIPGSDVLARALRAKLLPDAFYSAANRLLFEIMIELQVAGKPVLLEVLAEELKTRRQLEAVGGFQYLMQVTAKIPTTVHAHYFIEKVREKFVLRKLLIHAQDLVEKIHGYTGGLEDFVSRHSLRLQRWADFVTRMNRVGQREEAESAQKAMAQIIAGQVDHSRELIRGLPYADEMFLPYDVKNEDWMCVIAAGPSGGKSTRMREIAGANCDNGKRFAVFLLETSTRMWRWSLAASRAGVNLRELMKTPDQVLPENIRRFNEWDAAITDWSGERLFVFDDIYFFEDIERTVRELDRTLRDRDLAAGVSPEKARGLDGVVVDYLQIMNIREKIRMREEQVAYMSKGLKRLFKSLDISGFVGSQLNRKSRDEERRPRLSDLRESGAIEQDADSVELIYIPPTDKAGVAQTGDRSMCEAELISAKRRNGPANIGVPLHFYKTQTRFVDEPRGNEVRPGSPKPEYGYRREEGL